MPPSSKRRWFQFSTRGVLLLMTAVAIGLGFWVRNFHRRNQALIALRSIAQVVTYGGGPMRFESAPQPGWLARQTWFTRLLDKDFFNELVEVDMRGAARPNSDADFLPLAEFPDLKRLSLSFTGAGDRGMPYLKSLSRLEYLDIGSLKAGDDAAANIARLANLEELNLSRTLITDAGLSHLAGLSRLRVLALGETKVGDQALRLLANFPRLEKLSLDRTFLTGGAFADVPALPALTDLDLSGTAITDAGLLVLPTAPALQTLKLNDTAISDEALCRLGQITSLRTLELHGTKVSGVALRYLQKLPWLFYLDLCGTRIDDGGIDALNEMCSLVSVSLLDTGVTEAGLTRLKVAGSISTEPVDARTMAALRDITELDFTDVPLTDVVNYVKFRHEQELQIDPRLLNTAGFDAFRSSVTYARRDISLLRALEEILAPMNLVLVYRHSVPIIMSRPVKPALDVPQLTAGEKLSPRLQFELAQRTYLDFAYEPLPDVVQTLAQRHAIKIIIDEDAFGAEKAYVVPISRAIKDISLRAALGLLLEPLDMVCVAKGDTLVIRPAGEQ